MQGGGSPVNHWVPEMRLRKSRTLAFVFHTRSVFFSYCDLPNENYPLGWAFDPEMVAGQGAG